MINARVLFVGRQNAIRSQFAEALLRHYGEGRYEVFSAGLEPGIVPFDAMEVLREQGIHTTDPQTKTVDELGHLQFDYVINLCDIADQTNIPVEGNSETMTWHFDELADSADDRRPTLRRLRDEILNRVRLFILTDRGYA